VRRRGRVLVVQRPDSAERWAGLWEFPHGPRNAGELRNDVLSALRALTGLHVQLEGQPRVIRHTVTRHQIRMSCFSARYLGGAFASPFYQRARWVKPADL